MATIRKRGDRWQALIKRGHIRRAKSFGTKAAAQTWARRIESEIEQAQAHGVSVPSRQRFSDVLKEWEKQHIPTGRDGARDRSRARTVEVQIGNVPMADLTVHAMTDYIRRRLEQVGPQTVRHELTMVSRVIEHAGLSINAAKLARAKMRRALSTRSRSRRPMPGELGAVMAHLSVTMSAIVCLLIETCMRRGEVAAMRRTHISGRLLHIPDTKTGHPRTIPLSDGAMVALEYMGDSWGVQPDSITRAWVRACAAAGVEDLHLHDLRHEGTSRLFEGRTLGRPLTIPEVALVTGHRTWSQLQRYTQLQPESLLASSPASPQRPDSAREASGDLSSGTAE